MNSCSNAWTFVMTFQKIKLLFIQLRPFLPKKGKHIRQSHFCRTLFCLHTPCIVGSIVGPNILKKWRNTLIMVIIDIFSNSRLSCSMHIAQLHRTIIIYKNPKRVILVRQDKQNRSHRSWFTLRWRIFYL